jgi:hypothetical protein
MSFLDTAQPWKPRVQCGDGLGSGLRGRGPWGDGFGGHRKQRAAGSLVASEGSAAPRSEEAQLHRGLIKEYLGVVGHGVFRTPHSLCPGETSKSKVLTAQALTNRDSLSGR